MGALSISRVLVNALCLKQRHPHLGATGGSHVLCAGHSINTGNSRLHSMHFCPMWCKLALKTSGSLVDSSCPLWWFHSGNKKNNKKKFLHGRYQKEICVWRTRIVDARSLRTGNIPSYIYESGADTRVFAISIIQNGWAHASCELTVTLICMWTSTTLYHNCVC